MSKIIQVDKPSYNCAYILRTYLHGINEYIELLVIEHKNQTAIVLRRCVIQIYIENDFIIHLRVTAKRAAFVRIWFNMMSQIT